jgi:hypothetical protein
MTQREREKLVALIACIAGRVTKIDRDSKQAERTDLDAAWETLYAIRKDARAALRTLLKSR